MEKSATTATASGVAIANSPNGAISLSVPATLTKQSPQIATQSALVVIAESPGHDQDDNRQYGDGQKVERFHCKHHIQICEHQSCHSVGVGYAALNMSDMGKSGL